MTKQELQSKLEQTENLLSELKSELMKKDVKEEWPKYGDNYLTITGDIGMETLSFTAHYKDNFSKRKALHNVFKPSDRAFVERLARKQAFQRLLEKTAYELNGGTVEPTQLKYFLEFDIISNSIVVNNVTGFLINTAYFKTFALAHTAITLIGEDVLKEGFGL